MSVTMLIGFLARTGGFCTRATKWDTPTLNGHSLAPIGQNDPGPFSTAPATKTLTSTF